MDTYKYVPIDLDRPGVRLFRLFKGYFGDDIDGELFDGWINQSQDGIPYDALSYTWGSTQKVANITVSGAIMRITSNLYSALQHLRLSTEDRILWIDAICIDQENMRERTHQVQHMKHIYREAERVIVWLGEASIEIDHIMDSMQRLQENNVKLGMEWNKSALVWMQRPAERGRKIEENQIMKWGKGMKLLLKRPWFRRIWILQEIASARVAIVVCGRKTVSARTFARVPSLIGIEPDPHCQAVLDIMPGLSRRESWWRENRNLRTLLSKFHESEATDERDIVYALLGISSDAYQSDVLLPDYTKSIQQVIRDSTSFLLCHTRQDQTLYNFLDWTLPEFLRNLDSLGDKVLRIACENGQEAMARLLLENGADNNTIQLSLRSAVERGQETTVKLLLENGADNNTIQLSLRSAVERGQETIVKLLLENGADNNTIQLSLRSAVESGQETMVKLLLDNGAVTRATRSGEKSVLHEASLRGQSGIVTSLLERGADVDEVDDNKMTPFHYASKSGHIGVVTLLLKYGASIAAIDRTNQTPMHYALAGGHASIAKLLLDNVFNIIASEHGGGSRYLHRASSWGDANLGTLLLENGADIHQLDSFGRTPIHWAAAGGHVGMTRLLLDSGADLNQVDENGWTPLFWASKFGYAGVVKLLLENGADIEAHDCGGRKPLDLALEREHADVAKLLRSYPKENKAGGSSELDLRLIN